MKGISKTLRNGQIVSYVYDDMALPLDTNFISHSKNKNFDKNSCIARLVAIV